MLFVLTVCEDLCRMPSVDALYPISTAMECIKAPLLTKEVFEQNQLSVEKLVELHAFQDLAANPPTEYAHLKVDVNARLAEIRSTYQAKLEEGVEVPAHEYYSALSQVFLDLKDPHTLYVKPNFYGKFRLYFPFMIVEQDGFFYANEYPAGSNYAPIQSMYESLYGELEIDPTDRIFRVNGMDVLEWLTKYANLYDYSSKSDNGRVNSELSGALYNKRLDVYNIPAEEDQSIEIQYISGRTQTVHFVIKTSSTFANSDEARKLYE